MITLESAGLSLVEGLKRTVVKEIGGGQTRPFSWIVRGRSGQKIKHHPGPSVGLGRRQDHRSWEKRNEKDYPRSSSSILLGGLALPAAARAAAAVRVPLSFDYYYTYDMVVEALQALHKAYPAADPPRPGGR